jgi:hypothetical protein
MRGELKSTEKNRRVQKREKHSRIEEIGRG